MLGSLARASAITVLLATAAEAQLCRGLPDLAATSLSASVDAGFGRNSSVVIGSVAGGRPGGVFGSAGALVQSFDDLFVQSAPGTTGLIGWEFARAGSAVSFCPVAGGVYEHGPDIGTLKLRSLGALVGGYVGYRFDPMNPMGLSAYLGFTAAQFRTRATLAGVSGTTNTNAETLTAGLMLPNRAGFIVTPFVSIPMREGSESTLGLRFTWRLSARPGADD